MSTRLIVLLVLPLQIGLAAAQQAPAVPSRAQRDADNPLRLIIEAGRLKPRARTPEPERAPPAPERIQVRTRPVAPPAAAAASAPAPEAALTAPAPALQAAPLPIVAPPESRAVTEVRVPQSAAVTPAAPVPSPAVPELAAAVVPVPLQLTQMVEPIVPRRLFDRAGDEVEVVVTFTVNPDGSVARAAVQSSSSRAVNETVLEAVALWRYAPIPAAREHAVQLVLRRPD